MPTQEVLNYDRIARAITYLRANFREQPDLAEVARQVHLSPYHFQRLFTEWAGVSPKRFGQFLSLAYARDRLRRSTTNLNEIAFETGLSSSSRLHDLFVKTEAMTPVQYRDGGAGLRIRYEVGDGYFGAMLLASTERGICQLAFETAAVDPETALRNRFPNAELAPGKAPAHEPVWNLLRGDGRTTGEIKLHLRGTPFQLKVWDALLNIPIGNLSTYGDLANRIGRPGAARAVGTAIGRNEIALLIPCHRVIRSNGELGGYRWGVTRKAGILGREAAGVFGE